MARYRITNLKAGTIKLPPPLERRLDRGKSIEITAPAGMMEANFNRKYSALVGMLSSGLISITTSHDPEVGSSVEVATTSMLDTIPDSNFNRIVTETNGSIVYVGDGDILTSSR